MINIVDKMLRFGEGKKLRLLEEAVAQVGALEAEISGLSDEALRAKTTEFKERFAKARRWTTFARGVRGRARGGQAGYGHAPLRRPGHGRGGPASGLHRRDEDRRGQDARRHHAGLPQRPGRQRRARGHRQRLPGQPRRRVDGPGLPVPGPDVAALQNSMEAPTGARPTWPTSPTARTPSSASTICATTWCCAPTSRCSAATSSASWTRWTPSLSTRRGPRSSSPARAAGRQDLLRLRRIAGGSRAGEGEEGDYEIDEKKRTIAITEDGLARVEKELGIDNIYEDLSGQLVNHLMQALRAAALFKRDVDYLVQDGEVKIIDEFTGRLLEGRRYSEGLHQAIEAKQGVKIKEENQTLATITLQNYFRLYEKIAGMTGTAATEADEFREIYKMEVVVVPTNEPMLRDDRNDLIYKTEKAKFQAAAELIADCYKRGQPCWWAPSRWRNPSGSPRCSSGGVCLTRS